MHRSPFRQDAEREPTLRLEDRAQKTAKAVMDSAPGHARSILVLGQKGYVDDTVAARLASYGGGVDYADTGDNNIDIHGLWPIGAGIDAILAFEVLEHLMNPLLALRDARRKLEPLGRLYVTFPMRRRPLPTPHYHFHEFDTYRWGELVRAARLEIEHETTFRLTPWVGRWYPSLWRWATERIYFGCLKRGES